MSDTSSPRNGVRHQLFAAIVLAGCGVEAPGGGKAFTDGLGREVRVAVPARRIVSLAPSNTEFLFAAGAGAQVIGRDSNSDFPPEARPIRDLGSLATKLSFEALATLQPDLVLLAEIHTAEQARAIERLGLPAFLVPNPKSFGDLEANVRLIGAFTGRDDQASKLAASIHSRVSAVEEKVRGAARRPVVFYELDSTDATKPWSAGPGTFLHVLITEAGGENLCADSGHPFPRVSAETIIRRDPDVIIVGDAGGAVTVDSVRKRAGWETLKAVREGRVHAFDGDLASRPGPRLADALESLARLLHPDLFAK